MEVVSEQFDITTFKHIPVGRTLPQFGRRFSINAESRPTSLDRSSPTLSDAPPRGTRFPAEDPRRR
jgi:hypothetical protein